MGELISYPSNGEQARGYLALPTEHPAPAVVLLQEWWGLVPHIEDVADRLAGEGFAVLAPDLYNGETTTEPDEAQKKLMTLDIERSARHIVGAAEHLRGRAETAGSGVGVIGFCMGGSLALWTGTISRDVTTVVGFYPAMPWEMLQPTWAAYGGKHVLMHLSEGDGGSAAPRVQEAKQALDAAGADVTLFDYPGTHHAFFNDTRPEVYDADAAASAWQRTVAFLHQHLG